MTKDAPSSASIRVASRKYWVVRAISDGARGVDMGRNIFQSEHPAAMCRAVAKIVHEKFTDREAFQFYQELAAQDN